MMLIGLILLALSPGEGPAPAPKPALSITARGPDVQLEHLIALFEGSAAPDPASALAAWRRATDDPVGLGKGVEAAIASLNPTMAGELKHLDGTRAVIDFEADGGLLWSVAIPRDDGVFSAFATATGLTNGADVSPVRNATVTRLGPAGSPFMAVRGENVVIGGSIPAIDRGLEWLSIPQAAAPAADSSWRIEIDPRGLLRSRAPIHRQVAEAAIGLGIREIGGMISLDEGRMKVEVDSGLDLPSSDARCEPGWLDGIPATSSIVFAQAIKPGSSDLDRLFRAYDRVEKLDPAKKATAPLRTRVALIARAAGIDLETDLLAKLRGISGFLIGPLPGRDGGSIALHLSDERSAERLRSVVIPRVARSLGVAPPAGAEGKPVAVVAGIAIFAGPIAGQSLVLSWGEGLSPRTPEKNNEMRGLIAARGGREGGPPNRVIVAWPARLDLARAGSPISEALKGGAPIVLIGENRGAETVDTCTWSDLAPVVRRFLAQIPQKPFTEPRPR